MNRSKIVAILTGAISILLALAYLIIVAFLDTRGEMKPAPISYLQISNPQIVMVSPETIQTRSLDCFYV